MRKIFIPLLFGMLSGLMIVFLSGVWLPKEKLQCESCIDFQSQYEQRIVAETIAAEACGEGAHGMMAVANTIHNRAQKENKNAYEIVTAPSQYSGYVSPTRVLRYSECKETADLLAQNLDRLQDVTDGALYFKTKKEKKQKWHKILTGKIGAHEFYK